MRLAFIGFRHGHILGLYERAIQDKAIDVVAAAEDDPATRDALERGGQVRLTHSDWREMLESVECDAVAIGDYYGRRGEIAIAALQADRHVIADKPLCTDSSELERIAALAADRDRRVGLMLDLRDGAPLRTARRLIVQDQAIGEVHTVTFTAQHPLLRERRPAWYFEPGKHGGTINDIAIHALDAIPWVTGRRWAGIVAARAWNARLGEVEHFQDAAQLMLTLDNGGGVLGDVSYLAPDCCGYKAPQYWRMTFHGSAGVVEVVQTAGRVLLCGPGDDDFHRVRLDRARPGGYLESFRADIAGEPAELTTADVLTASRVALAAQAAADQHRSQVKL